MKKTIIPIMFCLLVLLLPASGDVDVRRRSAQAVEWASILCTSSSYLFFPPSCRIVFMGGGIGGTWEEQAFDVPTYIYSVHYVFDEAIITPE